MVLWTVGTSYWASKGMGVKSVKQCDTNTKKNRQTDSKNVYMIGEVKSNNLETRERERETRHNNAYQTKRLRLRLGWCSKIWP